VHPPETPRETAKGVLLQDLSWQEAASKLQPDAVIVFPLGAASKEHGPHLRLKNDLLMAEYLKERVLARAEVVIAPTITYHFYPAFLDYPGSISLRLETARDLVVDAVRSIARHGPRRFYVLNTGVSTVRALAPAAEILAGEGILLRYTDLLRSLAPIAARVAKEEGGTHADEIETSMMLYIAPDSVDMSKALKDFHPNRPGGLTRDPNGEGTYSPTGTWGDPTLATREKGKAVVEGLLAVILDDLEDVRRATIPVRAAALKTD
jgi:creatinine amidohydrolase